MTSAEVKAPLGCSRSPSSVGKEMGIGRTLRSHDFKLLPFPDERLDPNSVCSTGVHSHPSASNIQRMSSVVWQKEFSFLSLIHTFLSGCLFYAKWQSASKLSAPLLDIEEWQRCKQLVPHGEHGGTGSWLHLRSHCCFGFWNARIPLWSHDWADRTRWRGNPSTD